MKYIRYIGDKPRKHDTVARTGLVWRPGQVREVADDAAERLLRYPSVWVEVDDVPEAQVQTKASIKRLRAIA